MGGLSFNRNDIAMRFDHRAVEAKKTLLYCLRNNCCALHAVGETCETQVSCQFSTCLNGGTCVGHGAGYSCECAAGFTGDTCEVRTTVVPRWLCVRILACLQCVSS